MVLRTIRKRLSNYCICVVGVLRVVVLKKRKITDWKKHNSYPGSDSYRAFVLWPKMDLLRRRGAEPNTLRLTYCFLNRVTILSASLVPKKFVREKWRFRLLFLEEKTDEAWCTTNKDESATHGLSLGIKEHIVEGNKKDKSRDVKNKCQVFVSEWAKHQNCWYRGIIEESELKAIG